MENNKKLNNHSIYNNNRAFIPLNLYSPNHIANNASEKNFISKNRENSKNNSLKINNSINNLFDLDDYYHHYLIGKNNFRGSKITSKNYFKYLQRTQNKQLNFQNIKPLRLFFDKSNEYKINSVNGITNIKVLKSRRKEIYLNRSCPQINKATKKSKDKYNENNERKNNYEKIDKFKKHEDSNSYLEIEKNFVNNSDIYKIEYIKKIIRKHYFENYENLKDYFMILSGRERYITIDDIIFYLKEIIKVKLDKREIRQLLYTNGIIKVDFNNFKFIFFPEMRNNKIVSLRLRNEKCNLLKKEINVNIVNLKKSNTLKTVNIANENLKPLNIKKETEKVQINQSSREKIRIFPNKEIKKKLKNRELNSKMKFFLIDVNKDFILKRFNEKYDNSDRKFSKMKQSFNLNIINGSNKNKKFEGLKNLKKIINLKNNENNKSNIKSSKSYNNLNKNNLKLLILKLNEININKIEEKLKTSSTNTSNCKEIKYFKNEDNSNYRQYKSNFFSFNHKSLNSSRYLRNDLKNADLSKMAEYSTNNVNKLTSFYINRSKEKKENKTKVNRIQKNEIFNQDSNASKTFLFFKNDIEDLKSKEVSFSLKNKTQNEKEIKINKNSDILDFL